MSATDLTTLTAVKAWLGLTTTASDAVLMPLVSSVSRAIYSLMQRPSILPAAYSEVFNGNGSDRLFLKNWPLISISAMSMDGATVQQAPALPGSPVSGYGWVLESVDPTPPSRPSNVYLRGARFQRGLQNVAVSYRAGYQISAEPAIAPATSPWQVTAQQPFGAWASDAGVSYANGTALTAVNSGTPAQGQYAVSAGVYTFAETDAGAALLISYGFAPADLAQAALEWIAYRFRASEHIGVRSKSLGGQEVVGYETGAAPDFVLNAVQPFKRVAL